MELKDMYVRWECLRAKRSWRTCPNTVEKHLSFMLACKAMHSTNFVQRSLETYGFYAALRNFFEAKTIRKAVLFKIDSEYKDS